MVIEVRMASMLSLRFAAGRTLARSIALLLVMLAAPAWAQRPIIQVSADPSRSRNGETVLFKISVRIDDRGRMEKPQLPDLGDWAVLNSFRSESPRVVMTNGRVQYQYSAEYSYFLKPLRAGTLKIPSVKIVVAGKDYSTEAISVIVDRVSSAPLARSPRLPPPPGRPGGLGSGPNMQFDEDNLSGNGGGATGGLAPSEVPTNESFFVRPEINKTEAWAGEMLILSYVLYQRTRNLSNPELSKFPDFKGFLKEELFITKNFQQDRVQIGNEVFFRSELIRYAVFPIKTGPVKIDDFKFKAEVFTSPSDLIQSLMLGTPPPSMGGPIPMEKSSGVVNINSKPLPPTPPESVFTGAVGTFEIELKGPTSSVPAGTPFTLSLTIAGKGNVKMIEDVPLKLPPELELSRTTNLSELRQDTSGYKTFEYQILPRTVGDYRLEPIRFTYFDPDKSEYKTLESRPFLVSVEGGSSQGPGGAADSAAPKERAFSPVRSGPQEILSWGPGQRGPGTSLADHRLFWIFHGVLYALFGVAFARRRKDEAQEAYLKRAPWEVTARSIRALEPRKTIELAVLVDQWIREKLAGQLGEKDLHGESARYDIEQAVRKRVPAEFQKLLDSLKQLWSDLDVIRFAGSKKIPEGIVPAELFARAQKVVEAILARKRSDEQEAAES
jgi:hypothetical protein